MTELPEAALGPVPCARHHDVLTPLRCSRCETPICPKCLVYSPVGARCPDCASPLRAVTPTLPQYLRGAAAGLGVAAACGALLGFSGFGWLGFLLIGFAVGEVVSRAANRRGGTALGVVAFVAAVVGSLAGRAILVGLMLPAQLEGVEGLVRTPDVMMRLTFAVQVLVASLISGDGLFLVIAGVIAAARAR